MKQNSGQFIRYWNWLGIFASLFSMVLRFATEKSSQLVSPGWLILPVLLVAFIDLTIAGRYLRGTSLRPATVWARLAVLLAILVIVFDVPDATGNGMDGLFSHICFLATLASLVSVLGARRPGQNAWALLCGIFLVIGLLPMFEGVSLSRKFDVLDQLRLDSPWNYFLALVIFAGVSNYLPTRYCAASVVLGIGLGYHLRLIWKPDGRSPWRGEYWWILPWCLAFSIVLASLTAFKKRTFVSRFQSLWQPFRDAWGAAWALRVLERFNQTAVKNQWPVRLHWFGLMRESGMQSQTTDFDETMADKMLELFIRRFGDIEQIENL